MLSLLVGCSVMKEAPQSEGYYEEYDLVEPAPMEEMALSDSMDDRFEMKKEAFGGAQPGEPSAPPPPKSAGTAAPARMLHYNGYAKLQAGDPPAVLARAEETVSAAGGYVEYMDDRRATFRVPLAKFLGVYDEILKLGDVLQKSITAEDITDAFTDIELRLSVARETRNRLLEILDKTKKDKEKLKLLVEIQRLNQEIESLESRKRMLASLAEYSRMTLEVVPRAKFSGGPQAGDLPAFRWIRLLSPFSRDVARQGEPLALNVPPDMAELSERPLWIAEGPAGSAFWASRRPNYPEGDTAFWFEAVKLRLAPEFDESEELTAGEFKVLRLVEKSDNADYRYLVGLCAKGDKLEVVEVYFPNSAAEERHKQAVLDSIAKGAR